jgi:hypothetical protein
MNEEWDVWHPTHVCACHPEHSWEQGKDGVWIRIKDVGVNTVVMSWYQTRYEAEQMHGELVAFSGAESGVLPY